MAAVSPHSLTGTPVSPVTTWAAARSRESWAREAWLGVTSPSPLITTARVAGGAPRGRGARAPTRRTEWTGSPMLGSCARKRKAEGEHTPTRSVRFSHVVIRTHSMELWGGGGVPADDGPPLGMGWDIMDERRVGVEQYEGERENSRTPKGTRTVPALHLHPTRHHTRTPRACPRSAAHPRRAPPADSYCMSGSLEPRRRMAMLLRSGSTLKQIRTCKQAVARLNRQRWQAGR